MSKEKVEIKKDEVSSEVLFYFEFIGILIIILALVLLAKLGIIGQFLYILLLFVFGDWYWLFLGAIIFYGSYMIVKHDLPKFKKKRTFGFILTFSSILALSHIPYIKFFEGELIGNTWSYYLDIVENNRDNINEVVYGGGIIGAIILSVLKIFFGVIGTQIILYALLLLGITTLIDKSFVEYKEIVLIAKRTATKFRNKLLNEAKVIRNKRDIQTKTNLNNKLTTNKALVLPKQELEVSEELIVYENIEERYPYISLLDNYSEEVYNPMQLEISKKIANQIQGITKEFPIRSEIVNAQITSLFSWLYLRFEKALSDYRKEMLLDDIEEKLSENSFRIRNGSNNDLCIEFSNKYIIKLKIAMLVEKGISNTIKEINNSIAIAFDENLDVYMWNLIERPHLIVASTDRYSINNFIKTIIIYTLFRYSKDEFKFLLIDFQNEEMNGLEKVPHFVTNTVKSIQTALATLEKLIDEMSRRYNILRENDCEDIELFNQYRKKRKYTPMARLVVIITEINDIVFSNKSEIEQLILQVSQLGAKVGIHLIVATSNSNQKAISSIIKSNIPNRIIFKLAKKSTSHWLMENDDATKLDSAYDFILSDSSNPKGIRLQIPSVTIEEFNKVINYMKN